MYHQHWLSTCLFPLSGGKIYFGALVFLTSRKVMAILCARTFALINNATTPTTDIGRSRPIIHNSCQRLKRKHQAIFTVSVKAAALRWGHVAGVAFRDVKSGRSMRLRLLDLTLTICHGCTPVLLLLLLVRMMLSCLIVILDQSRWLLVRFFFWHRLQDCAP